MKTKLLLSIMLLALTDVARAQNTAFTYQGRLSDGANPGTGRYDLRFSLHDDLNGGSNYGFPVTNSAVVVSNGLFTTTLDFGQGPFNGTPLWLQIAARSNGVGAFTFLSPRQALTPAPYSLRAANAGTVFGSGILGIVPDVSLSANIARLNGANQVFTGTSTFSNPANQFAGNGAGLVGLNAWALAGNSGTTPSTQFLGTTDNQPLELRVNGTRTLRLEPNPTAPNVIGGAAANEVTNGIYGAVIAGGGSAANPNRVGAIYASVLGGAGNTASGNYATAMGDHATASGYASLGLGYYSVAGGFGSFAAGTLAKANHDGAFVWSDQTFADFASTANNQFLIRAGGGVGIGTPNPQSQLHVYSGNPVTTLRLQSSGGPGFGRVEFLSDPQGNPNEWRPSYIQSTDNGNYTGGLSFHVNGTGFTNRFGDTEVMRLVDGRVGINTPNPLYTLDVNGWARATALDALAVGVADLYSSGTLHIRDILQDGDQTFSGNLRQMLTLGGSGIFSAGPGVGLQTNNVYFRSDADYSWFRGGFHSDAPYDAGGFLGREQMRLSGGYLMVRGDGEEQAYLGGDGAGGDVEIGSRNPGIMNVGFWNSAAFSHMNLYAKTFNPVSDRNLKQDFQPVDPQIVLAKVAALPVTEWSYKGDANTRHLGPTAQDFKAAFGLGNTNTSIATVDADGVALAAIQGLNQKLTEELKRRDAENAVLNERLETLEKILNAWHRREH